MKNHRLLPPALILISSCALSLSAQVNYEWTGTTDGQWDLASNWNPNTAAPGGATTDIANFDTASANSSITLDTAISIGALNFNAGAGAYTLSGEALTLSSGDSISNTSGNHQIINTNMSLAGANTINVSSGSSLTLSGTIYNTTSGGNFDITGSGIVNLTGKFANYTTFTNLQVMQASTVNYDTTSFNGVNNYIADSGRLNLHRNPASGGITLQLKGDGSEIYLSQAGMATATTLRFRGDGDDGKTLSFGADFSGTGISTHSGAIQLNDGGSGVNNNYRFDAAADNTLSLTGTITDTNASGSGTKVQIIGDGIVRFAGSDANTSQTPIEVLGTLELAKDDEVNAIGGGSITIMTDGHLQMAANNQIADTASLHLSGGSYVINGFDESMGELSVAASGGTIDFGGLAATLNFDSLATIVGTLTIEGWSEEVDIFFSDGSGWDTAALGKVNFSGFGTAQYDSETGRLSAIPEPSATAAIMGIAGLLFISQRRIGLLQTN
ncbi:hypothetical protein QEH59_09425 [Coraliomargarita sp. SDUM461004]|uniref:PEP-CTERM sorting domain-containing protein n=1 Tax=Thalassobacterium sedimentorum TaxID=3041258 RepID=A0ABU1ALK1_9BACT|nr:hypothetical protein [Coraliomargarita sp. SDUM461004]MDQ8194646.1 hypothetical protein [Coraliomargarita sp. SDUM461004]